MAVSDGANEAQAPLEVVLRDVDEVPPTLASATVDGASLVLGWSEPLDQASAPAGSAFTVHVAPAGDALTPGQVAVSGAQVTLTLPAPVTSEDTVTVSYTPPGAGPIQDVATNLAAALDRHAVDNDTPPVLALNVDAIAGDDTVNIAEKAAGFTIGGDTGTEEGASVSVTVGSQSPLAATSDSDGTWSVDVPADAAYITGTSVAVTVNGLARPGSPRRAP